ncbi:hypothetical protein C4J83_2392 [Pseudomonas sp. LBUM920]|nr:hypothetical protein C4J83_2392 [Pseudomonas sp. LBUM920]
MAACGGSRASPAPTVDCIPSAGCIPSVEMQPSVGAGLPAIGQSAEG